MPAATPAYRKKTVSERARTRPLFPTEGLGPLSRSFDSMSTHRRHECDRENQFGNGEGPEGDAPRPADRDEQRHEERPERGSDSEAGVNDPHRTGSPVNGDVGIHAGVQQAPGEPHHEPGNEERNPRRACGEYRKARCRCQCCSHEQRTG